MSYYAKYPAGIEELTEMDWESRSQTLFTYESSTLHEIPELGVLLMQAVQKASEHGNIQVKGGYSDVTVRILPTQEALEKELKNQRDRYDSHTELWGKWERGEELKYWELATLKGALEARKEVSSEAQRDYPKVLEQFQEATP